MNDQKTIYMVAQVLKTFVEPQRVNSSTGEVLSPPAPKVQVLTEIPKEGQDTAFELHTLKATPEHLKVFEAAVGKTVAFPVGTYSNFINNQKYEGFFIQRGARPFEFKGFVDAFTLGASSSPKPVQAEEKKGLFNKS